MPQPPGPRHTSFVGPMILISIGVLLLAMKLYPEFDPLPWLFRYWPVLLIAIGLGKIWDSYYARQHPERATAPWISGAAVAWVLLIVFLVLAFWHGPQWHTWGWNSRRPWHERHDTQSVELQGAKKVNVDLTFPAGRLDVDGGSAKLLDADFRYDRSDNRPRVDYAVSGEHGQLTVSGRDDHVHFGGEDSEWQLRLGGDESLDMNVNIGAGEGYMRFDGINLETLRINMGAGKLDLDLTKARKTNIEADVEGGVGTATIHLPRDVGVRVVASGGIGGISADGLRHDGDSYENDQYGKSSTTINMTVHGGVGHISLLSQ